MKRNRFKNITSFALGALLLGSLVSCGASAESADKASYSIVNVSYDPTRELYVNYNEAFRKYLRKRQARTLRSLILTEARENRLSRSQTVLRRM